MRAKNQRHWEGASAVMSRRWGPRRVVLRGAQRAVQREMVVAVKVFGSVQVRVEESVSRGRDQLL